MAWLKVQHSVLASIEKIWHQLNEKKALTYLELLHQFLEGELPPEQAQKYDLAIQVLGLQSEVTKLRAFLDKIPPAAWQLFTPLSQLQDELTLPLIASSGLPEKVEGPWNIAFGFEARAKLGIEAYSARENIAWAPHIKAQAGEAYLQIEAVGSLNASVNAGAQFSSGSAHLGFGAGGQVELAYLFKDVPKSLVISGLLKHAPSLRSPFQLKGIGQGFKKQLSAVHLQAQGNLQLNGGLSVGQTWGTNFIVDNHTLGVETPVGIDADVGAHLRAQYQLKGGFELLVEPAAGGWVSVKLRRSKNRNQSLDFNLDSQVVVTGLDKIGHAIIKNYLPDAQLLIEQLSKYLDLAELLRDELGKKLSDFLNKPDQADLRQHLVLVLTGAGQSENLSTALLKMLAEQANNQLNFWEGQATDVAEKAIQDTVLKLGLAPETQQLLTSKLKGELVKALEKIKADLRTDLDTWLQGKPAAQLTALLKPLDSFGALVSQWVAQAQDLADKFLKPVLAFLNTYQSYRQKIQKAVDGAAKVKLGLSFARSWQKTNAGEVMLNVYLNPSVPAAEAFYRQIVLGSFSELLAGVQQAADKGEDLEGVKLVGGSFSKSFGKKVQTDFSIDFGKSPSSSQSLREMNLNATWDLSGNILTASGKANVQKTFRFLGETRAAQFVNLLELAGAQQESADKIFSSSVSLTFRDERIHVKEIRGILENLERLSLLPSGITDRTIAHYDAMDRKHVGAAIGIGMPLDMSDLNMFLKQPRDKILEIGFENNKNIFLNRKGEHRVLNDFLEQRIPGTRLAQKIEFLLAGATEPFSARDIFSGGKSRFKAPAYQAWTYSRYAEVLARMQVIMNDVAAIPLKGANREANLKKIFRLMDTFNREVNMVLKVRKWLDFFTKSTVPKSTLAFILSLRELSSRDGDVSPLIPVIRWATDGYQVDQITL